MADTPEVLCANCGKDMGAHCACHRSCPGQCPPEESEDRLYRTFEAKHSDESSVGGGGVG
jgi:hypothetical protein